LSENIIGTFQALTPEEYTQPPFKDSNDPSIFLMLYYFPFGYPTPSGPASHTGQPCGQVELKRCKACFNSWKAQNLSMHQFKLPTGKNALTTLDLCGGIGSLSGGMAETCPLHVTHAIEIAPSAAQTFQ
jgi:hypothetical protein